MRYAYVENEAVMLRRQIRELEQALRSARQAADLEKKRADLAVESSMRFAARLAAWPQRARKDGE